MTFFCDWQISILTTPQWSVVLQVSCYYVAFLKFISVMRGSRLLSISEPGTHVYKTHDKNNNKMRKKIEFEYEIEYEFDFCRLLIIT